MNGLLTDLYELTMAAGYFEAGKAGEKATFEFTIRRLPAHRNFVLDRRHLRRSSTTCSISASPPRKSTTSAASPSSRSVCPAFFDYLRDFRFTGDLFAVPEGTAALRRRTRAHPPRAHHRSADPGNLPALRHHLPDPDRLQSRALRRRPPPDARSSNSARAARTRPKPARLGARAAYIGGCAGTSNTLAGFRYGIPVMGTAAHSWVMSFPCEMDAFRKLQRVLGDCHRPTDRYLRHPGRRAPRRQTRRPAVGRPPG